jgi:ubiquinone/menaquinone biosynthesis C-methylase UbiE
MSAPVEYAPTQERCHVEHMAAGDVRDHVERYTFAAGFVQKGDRVLDIACGTGYGSDLLRTRCQAYVTGVDVSAGAVAEAKRVYGDGHGNGYLVGTMAEFAALPFDVVVSFETIEHIQDDMAALANLRRLLKPGGTLILSTPNRPVNSPRLRSLADKPGNAFHVREYTTAEMAERLERAGFGLPMAYGQKQRRLIRNKAARLAYSALAYAALPGHYSAKVQPLRRGLEPRYSVLVCKG